MKPLKVAQLISILIVGCTAANAHAGPESSGGGDRFAAHFAAVGKRLNQAFTMICNVPAPSSARICQYLPGFAYAVQSARILPRMGLTGTDGRPREAGPDGRGNIELNVPVYQKRIAVAGSSEATVALAAHEYMISSRQELIDEYGNSGELLRELRNSFIDMASVAGSPAEVASAPKLLPCVARYTPARNYPGSALGDPTSMFTEVWVGDSSYGQYWKAEDAHARVGQLQKAGICL